MDIRKFVRLECGICVALDQIQRFEDEDKVKQTYQKVILKNGLGYRITDKEFRTIEDWINIY